MTSQRGTMAARFIRWVFVGSAETKLERVFRQLCEENQRLGQQNKDLVGYIIAMKTPHAVPMVSALDDANKPKGLEEPWGTTQEYEEDMMG